MSENNQRQSVFADGVKGFNPHKNAPDFVLAEIKIKPNKLIEWLNSNPQYLGTHDGEAQLSLTVKKSKEGNIYTEVNTFKPANFNG